jgi:hypothetical protein
MSYKFKQSMCKQSMLDYKIFVCMVLGDLVDA